jgi:serine protease Do
LRCGVALLVLLSAGLMGSAQSDGEERAPRGYLGVELSPTEEAKNRIVVKEVMPDSPAARAGLESGDRIVKVDDEQVTNVDKFLAAIAAHKPGDKLALGVVRGDKERNLTATLGERPKFEGPSGLPGLLGLPRQAFLGVQSQELTPELKMRLNVDTDAGVVVTEVMPNSPALKAGLKRDDVITSFNGNPVKDPAELREAIRKAGVDKEVTLQVVRGKEKQTLTATLRGGMPTLIPALPQERLPRGPESIFDPGRRVRELEKRVEELEKRVRELEKKK